MSDGRLPAHLEVAALVRATEATGGFATIAAKGERDAGVILILTIDKAGIGRLWERMPRLDGRRIFEVVREQIPEEKRDFEEYLARRLARDRDIWLVELTIPDAERFIAEFSR